MSLCNVRRQMAYGMARAIWKAIIACCGERGPVAISVARVCQSARVPLGASFGPLLHREALCGHDRNRMTQDLARRKLQLFLRGRRFTEANDIGKPIAAIWVGSGSRAPDDLGSKIARLHFRFNTFRHETVLSSSASAAEYCHQEALRLPAPYRSS
jgi:hypothetical protein